MLQPKIIKNTKEADDNIESLQVIISSLFSLKAKVYNFMCNVSGPTSIQDKSIYKEILKESSESLHCLGMNIKMLGGDVISDLISHSRLSVIEEADGESDSSTMALSIAKSLDDLYNFCEKVDVDEVDEVKEMCQKNSYILQSSR